jgi:DNA-binding MarR family transcriptional regulator
MKTSESRYSQCFYFTANSLARKIEKLAQKIWKKVDLSPSHAYLLLTVLDEPGIQPGLLSDHLQLTPSTVTRLIEKLEEKKLVVRTSEGKITNLYPTPKAKELKPILINCVVEFNKAYMDLLGAEESAKVVKSMLKMADKLED